MAGSNGKQTGNIVPNFFQTDSMPFLLLILSTPISFHNSGLHSCLLLLLMLLLLLLLLWFLNHEITKQKETNVVTQVIQRNLVQHKRTGRTRQT